MTIQKNSFNLSQMKTLNHSQLVEKIATIKGMAIVGLLATTDARARKTNNPFFPITKTIRAIGFVGANYENAVNREANRQGETPEFQAESLPWGQWLIPGKIIEHKGEMYLRTQTTPGNRRKTPAKVLNYRAGDGKFISRDEAKPFLPVARESNKQQEETGIQQTVWVRTYSFDSLKKMRIAGQTYHITR